MTLDLPAERVTPPDAPADPTMSPDTGPAPRAEETEPMGVGATSSVDQQAAARGDVSPEPAEPDKVADPAGVGEPIAAPERRVEPKPVEPAATESFTPSAFALGGPSTAGAAARAAADPGTRPGAGNRRGASFLSLLAAALLGGALALGGAYLAARTGFLPDASDAGAPELQAELDALRSEVAATRTDAETARAEIAALQSTPAADGPAEIGSLRDQVAALEGAVAELRDGPAGTDAGVRALEDRLAGLEQSLVSAAPEAAAGVALTALDQRVTDLAGQMEQLRATADVSDQLRTGVDQATARLDEATARIEALEGRPPPDLSGLETAVAELRAGLAQLTERLDASDLDERLAALDPRVAETERLVGQAVALGPALAADALAAAVEDGRPFAAEIAALKSLGADDPALAELEAHAEAGLPSVAALAAEFEQISDGLATRSPIPPSAGLVDRLWQSAGSLVEVRPAGEAEGGDPAAIFARIEDALRRGDLEGALAEREQLPEDARQATAAWAEKVDARLAAENLAARLRTDALSRVGTQS